jgi:PAS domain S-box-containing protein
MRMLYYMKNKFNPLPMKPNGVYYKWLVGLAVGLTLAFFAVLAWRSWLSYSDFQTIVTTGASINESNHLIGQLDEALTMSARMAAATGDRKWEDRYRLLEPQLDEAIRKVKRLAPTLSATKGAQKTDDANQALVDMEHRSFKLTEEGRQDAARAILSSPEYEEAKYIYANGLQQIQAALSEQTSSFLRVAQYRLTLTLTLMGIILPLLLVLWAQVIRTARINSANRIAAEKALHESQKQYFNLVEGTTDLVTRVSVDGRFLFVNHAAQEIYGLSSEEFIGRLAFEFIHPEDRGATEAAFQSWLKSDIDVFVYENRMIGIEGRIHHLAWSISPEHDENGNVSGFASTARDITEQKRLEAEKEKLEVINRQLQKAESLGRMSGAIAHHFNNKLNVVMGYLEMVIRDLPPGDSHAENLGRAMRSAQKASEVSGNLLAYLGQIRNKIDSLDLSEICSVLLPVLLAGMPKNVALETDLPSPGPYITADAKQIQQILTNLVINAWEAIGEEPGTVRLNVKTVPATDIPESCLRPLGWQPREQHYACLEVADSGCGIKEKDMDKLFDPFFSTKFTGRGMGLPIVLGTVKSHKGGIMVENRIGGGSVFKVFFPLSNQIPLRQTDQMAEGKF